MRLVQFLAAVDDTALVGVDDFAEAAKAEGISITAARSAIAALEASGIIKIEHGRMQVIQEHRWLDRHRRYLSS